jgi:hypothetical protein
MASRSSSKSAYTSRFVILEQLREVPLIELAKELINEGVILPHIVDGELARNASPIRSNPIVHRYSTTAPGYDCKLIAYPQHAKFDNKRYLVPSFFIKTLAPLDQLENRDAFIMRIGLVRTAVSVSGGSFHACQGMVCFPLVSPASKPGHYYPPSENECVAIASVMHANKAVPTASAAIPATQEDVVEGEEKKAKKKKRADRVEVSQIWSPQHGATISIQVLAVQKDMEGFPIILEEHSLVWDHPDVIRTICFTHEREPAIKKNKKAKKDSEEAEEDSGEIEEKKARANDAMSAGLLDLLALVEAKKSAAVKSEN